MRRQRTVLLKTILFFLVALSLLSGISRFASDSSLAQVKDLVNSWSRNLPSPGKSLSTAPGKSQDSDATALRTNTQVKAPEKTNAKPNLVSQISAAVPHSDSPIASFTPTSSPPNTPPGPISSSVVKDGNATLLQIAPSYIKSIMTPEDGSFPRLDCPAPKGDRYDYLRDLPTNYSVRHTPSSYFFALDLHQCAHILPRLLGSIVETMRFLGPKNCALSVVEGRSDDGTFEILKLLREEVEGIGATYFLNTNEIHPGAKNGVSRIEALAELRNQALRPLINHADHFSIAATVIFINDVAICMEDILELVHQRLHLNADMVCAMDWTYVGPDPTFYDVWVARGMNGDSFFEIPPDGNWNSAWNLFWNNPTAQERQGLGNPFQVFSCWNGAVAFTAKPLIEKKIKFRNSYEEECLQGEPQLFCKDMWYLGYNKIATIPSVNLEYKDEAAKKIKAAKGYVSSWVDAEVEGSSRALIEWETKPPDRVKCIAGYQNQTWQAWDDLLTEHPPTGELEP